jgi:hypothetical protein
VAALQCAEAWLGLNPLGGSGPCFTPGQLHSQQGQLLGAALALLPGGGGPHVTEAAVQLLLAVFGPEGFAEEPADLAATSALARALLACAPRLADPGGDALAAGVAKLAGAAAERLPDYVCGAMAEAAALGDLMLGVLGRGGGPDLAALTLDYFLVANTGGWVGGQERVFVLGGGGWSGCVSRQREERRAQSGSKCGRARLFTVFRRTHPLQCRWLSAPPSCASRCMRRCCRGPPPTPPTPPPSPAGRRRGSWTRRHLSG